SMCATDSVYNLSPPPHFPTLSLHGALPISSAALTSGWTSTGNERAPAGVIVLASLSHRCLITGSAVSWIQRCSSSRPSAAGAGRSEEHTSELQSRENLVCRLLLEKKKMTIQ